LPLLKNFEIEDGPAAEVENNTSYEKEELAARARPESSTSGEEKKSKRQGSYQGGDGPAVEILRDEREPRSHGVVYKSQKESFKWMIRI
jgi:hypothetical protein